jgi:serine/threonine protein kinase
MPLRPSQYGDFSKYLLAKSNFKSIRSLVNAALNIVEGFGALHRAGYNYQDLNDGNFFVNFDTGDVLICDNDNVMGHGYSSGIAGKCRYMAPEVVLGNKRPDKQTDRFSLAVVLFLLLLGNHPLEGKGTNPPCMTEELEKEYYGSNPVFIFDPINKDNIPIQGIHNSAIAKWPQYPQYIRDAFIKAFGSEQLRGQKPRLMEKEWLETFIRLRSEIIQCGCGREHFVDPTERVSCKCGKQINVPAYLKFKKLNVPLYPAVNLYACHTISDSEDFKTVTAEVIVSKNNPGSIGVRNLSDITWYVAGADGKSIPKGKDEVVKIASGLTIDFGKNLTAEIVGN